MHDIPRSYPSAQKIASAWCLIYFLLSSASFTCKLLPPSSVQFNIVKNCHLQNPPTYLPPSILPLISVALAGFTTVLSVFPKGYRILQTTGATGVSKPCVEIAVSLHGLLGVRVSFLLWSMVYLYIYLFKALTRCLCRSSSETCWSRRALSSMEPSLTSTAASLGLNLIGSDQDLERVRNDSPRMRWEAHHSIGFFQLIHCIVNLEK